MRARMALPKAVGYVVFLLVIYYSLENQGYRESLNVFFEELMGTKASHIHAREKRDASLHSSDYVIQAVITTSDLERLQTFLRELHFPLVVNSTEITSIDTTTVCSSNMTGTHQCRCEKDYAWSYNNCIIHEACDAIIGDTCGCINALPTDDQYCQLNTSVTASLHSSDYVIQAVITTSDLERLQTFLRELHFPLVVNSTEITSIDTTTVCSSNMTAYQCRCEKDYAWSYNNCIIHEACDAIIGDTCGCINALPTDDQYCQLNTSVTETTPPTPSPTPPNEPMDIEIVLDLRIPVSSVPLNFISLFRDTLKNVPLPYNISPSYKVIGLDFTTGCYPNSTGGLQCECEERFAWSCDKCVIYGACSHATSQTCGCINGLPDGEFCEPITNATQCSTPGTTTPMTTTTPVTTTPMTMPTPVTTTPMTTTTPVTTTPMTTPTPVTTTTPMKTPMTTTTIPVTTTPMLMTTTPMTKTTPVTTTTTPMKTPMTTTTTTIIPMTTTTTPMPMTTTPITITPMMTTTPITTTTTPMPMTTRPTTNATMLSFTMDIPFDNSFNEETSSVYRNSYNTIERQSKKHFPNFEAIQSITFRRGSTIGDYIIRASSFPETEIESVKAGVFTELAEIYPMIFESPTPLEFNSSQVYFGSKVTVKCGPPPKNLNFSADWQTEWKLNNRYIIGDSQHTLEQQDGTSVLSIERFFSTDNGLYECTLRKDNSTFRQKGSFNLKAAPSIEVIPIKKRIKCEDGVKLECSVSPRFYEVELKDNAGDPVTQFPDLDCSKQVETFTCQEKTHTNFNKTITLLLSPAESIYLCEDDIFGVGNRGNEAVGQCAKNKVGEQTAVCQGNTNWEVRQDNCILREVQELLQQSKFLDINSLPAFLEKLSNVTTNLTADVVESPANINAIVEILNNVADLNIPITKASMTDILITAGVLTIDDAKTSWETLNENDTQSMLETESNSLTAESVSSTFLLSLENITRRLTNDSFNIETPSILLNKTTFTDTFNADFEISNSSVEIDIPESDGGNKSITVITFASMDNVLPARDEKNSSLSVINGRVVLVQSEGTINNVSFIFDINDKNESLGNPQCVFWNFSLFDGLGGWDSEGCELVRNKTTNETVTCNCNHLTSFSILMSPYSPEALFLDYITYIGVGISMASLVICLIIEAVIWRKIRRNNTSYLRHVSIVNIAVSLLIANIWFIIGAAISDEKQRNLKACTAATFFIHFFYLALFFWMLSSGLLLLYRTVSVFDGGLSKKSMLAIGFILGYGAPLIIVIITIAVTAPRDEYIRRIGGCWLNMEQSMALLAFVIPALIIVVINLMILIVVIYKMLRRRAVADSAQAAERHVLVVIARSLAVLTPFFGLTWGLGIGTMVEPKNIGIHASFAFFNSLQGFFILVFGTLLDKKVRSEIVAMSQSSKIGTRSTSAGISSSSGLGFFRNWRRGRDGYNTSSSTSAVSHSVTNT